MAISDADYKLLWGRAAGICSNPACDEDLTVMLEGKGFNVGEMAHIIAHSEGGPRGHSGGGDDTYANLILLCPTCHRKIDKAPEGEYPADMLLKWKDDHETNIRSKGKAIKFDNVDDLKKAVSRKLSENKYLWATLGPRSEVAEIDPGSNLATIWELRKLDTIVPNNNWIINCIESNQNILSQRQFDAFVKFKTHARAFERNQYGRLDTYPLFPAEFEIEFGHE